MKTAKAEVALRAQTWKDEHNMLLSKKKNYLIFVEKLIMYSHAALNDMICSEKCVIRRFRSCVNVIECTDANLDGVAYYTPGPYGMAYCS